MRRQLARKPETAHMTCILKMLFMYTLESTVKIENLVSAFSD